MLLTVSRENYEALLNADENESLLIGHTYHREYKDLVVEVKKVRTISRSNQCVWRDVAGRYETGCGVSIEGDFYNIAEGGDVMFCPGCGKPIVNVG